MKLTCFKAYDIRGRLGEELNEEIAYAIGRAFAIEIQPKKVVVGGDIRLSSEQLKFALARGLQDEGVDVVDLGMTGTEEIYFATKHLGVCGGVEVTASHNPLDYNGMKLVREDSKPISGDTGLRAIQSLAEKIMAGELLLVGKSLREKISASQDNPRINSRQPSENSAEINSGELGKYVTRDLKTAYAKHMLEFIHVANLKPLKLVVNCGNGAAGPALDAIEQQLIDAGVNIEFIKVHHKPDGHFPNGIPNPLLPECRADTANAVKEHNADMGIAWDGDFDRCFLFDEQGEFIEGYYIVGLLAEAFLSQGDKVEAEGKELQAESSKLTVTNSKLEAQNTQLKSENTSRHPEHLSRHPELDSGSKEKIIHDPRLSWNTIDIVERAGGEAVMSKTGHAFIKERMRIENAIYGGEMSAHHYFRDFAYCDSGMIPWLLVAELLSVKGTSLSSMVKERINAFPSSGEINSKLVDPKASIAKVLAAFKDRAVAFDQTDGISLEFKDEQGQWRFNLRSSNTEPVVRLNVESKGDVELMLQQTEQILQILRA
ncbi:phosphomannomutase CpsG [Thalassomonas sp. M1454]|uniref:phosphomannomutase CpsG n=1 Tax=Thalassomonas sp. M1454 TaxID=2594477 RepID=UPI0021B12F7B|nr:phosphomannomutase CpsG [Thalassomonas sp. M1454]